MRIFWIAIALGLTVLFMSPVHGADISLTKGDFAKAEVTERSPPLILASLSPSGIAKFAKVSKHIGKTVKIHLAGEDRILTLQDSVTDKIQIGPFDKAKTKQMVEEINKK